MSLKFFYTLCKAVMRIAFCLIVISSKAFANDPSFDCSEAYAADELAICNNDELADLDLQISDWFSYISATYDLETAKTISLPFLKKRSLCGANSHCIKKIQVREIYAFSNLERALRSQKPNQISANRARQDDAQGTTQEFFDKLDAENTPDEHLNTRTNGPSFNCDNAKKLDEITICKDEKLSELDLNLHEQFNLHKKDLDKKEGYNTQKWFLKKRRACKADATCIGKIYNEALNKYKTLYEVGFASQTNSNAEPDRGETEVNSNNNPINISASPSNNDDYTGLKLIAFILIALYLIYICYVDDNADKCPSCGTFNWHSKAESYEILDRKMRLGTFDMPTQHNGFIHHHYRNYIYYDEVIRYNFSCKCCGNKWSSVRKKRG